MFEKLCVVSPEVLLTGYFEVCCTWPRIVRGSEGSAAYCQTNPASIAYRMVGWPKPISKLPVPPNLDSKVDYHLSNWEVRGQGLLTYNPMSCVNYVTCNNDRSCVLKSCSFSHVGPVSPLPTAAPSSLTTHWLHSDSSSSSTTLVVL